MTSVAERRSASEAVERIEFVPGRRGHIYTWTGLPPAPTAAVVICSSICADFTANYHRERELAYALLGQGIAVARFHYFGEGNSDGEARDVTLPSMLDDAGTVLAHLAARVPAGAVLGFVGTRLGAVVAARMARQHGGRLALWEPITEPVRFFDEAFRAKRMSQVVTDTGAAASWREELARNGVLDLLGYRVYPELIESLEGADDVTDPPGPEVFVARFERRRKATNDAAAAPRPGNPDRASFVVPESWWFHDETLVDSGDLVEVTAGWLVRALLEPGPADDAGAPPPASPPPPETGRERSAEIGAADETLVFFDGPGARLAGVLTVPPEPNGLTVMLPWGSGPYPSPGRNRIRTRLARAAAAEGFHALRFDYVGTGESEGDYRDGDLNEPFTAEIEAAYDWLAGRGLDRVVIVAKCFGGWSSLAAAPRLPGLEGVAIIRAPVRRDHKEVRGAARSWREWLAASRRLRLTSLLDPRRRAVYRKMLRAKLASTAPGRRRRPAGAGSRFSRAIEHLVEREVPLLLLYSVGDDFHRDLQAELDSGLSAVLDRADERTRLLLVNERLKGDGTLDGQDRVAKEVMAWLREIRAT